MDCKQALTDATAALANVAGGASDDWQEHLAGCADCRTEHARTVAVWGALPDPAAAMTVREDFADAVRTHMTAHLAERRARRARALRRSAIAGGGLAFALAVTLIVGRMQREPGKRSLAAANSQPPTQTSAPVTTALPPPLDAFVADRLPSDGQRGRAIALIGARYGADAAEMPSQVVAALVRTLKTDRNPGVRRKAAEALAGLEPTREICDAFLAALRSDRNPVVRGIAVEALGRAARRMDGPSIEGLRERASDNAESDHLRVKAARTLRTIAL